jgi:hypothetical protein
MTEDSEICKECGEEISELSDHLFTCSLYQKRDDNIVFDARIHIASTGRVFHEEVKTEKDLATLADSVEENHPGDVVVTAQQFYRASGDMICKFCKTPYYDHPLDTTVEGYDGPFLRRLCNGDLVKL